MKKLFEIDLPDDAVPGSLSVTVRREGQPGTVPLEVRELKVQGDVAEALMSADAMEREARRWENEAACKTDEYPAGNTWEVEQARAAAKAAADLRALAGQIAQQPTRRLRELLAEVESQDATGQGITYAVAQKTAREAIHRVLRLLAEWEAPDAPESEDQEGA